VRLMITKCIWATPIHPGSVGSAIVYRLHRAARPVHRQRELAGANFGPEETSAAQGTLRRTTAPRHVHTMGQPQQAQRGGKNAGKARGKQDPEPRGGSLIGVVVLTGAALATLAVGGVLFVRQQQKLKSVVSSDAPGASPKTSGGHMPATC